MSTTYLTYIDGQWVPARSGATYENRNPADHRDLIGLFPESGREDVDAAVAAGALTVEPLPIEDIARMQPHQARRKRLVFARTAALAFVGQPRPMMKGLLVAEAARAAPLAEAARDFLGTIRRTLQGRRSRL